MAANSKPAIPNNISCNTIAWYSTAKPIKNLKARIKFQLLKIIRFIVLLFTIKLTAEITFFGNKGYTGTQSSIYPANYLPVLCAGLKVTIVTLAALAGK